MVVRLQNMMRSHCEEALSLLTADNVDQGGVTAYRRNDTVDCGFWNELKFVTFVFFNSTLFFIDLANACACHQGLLRWGIT